MLDFPRWKIISILIVCLWGAYIALPNAFNEESRESLGGILAERTINLGLDLQGGSHLLLEVDFGKYLGERLGLLLDDTKTRLRDKKIRYKRLSIKTDADKKKYISFYLRNTDDKSKMEDLFNDLYSEIELVIGESGNIHLQYRDDELENMRRGVIQRSIEAIRRRVDETGTREPIIQSQGDVRIILQVPGLKDPERLKKILGKTAKLSFHLMDEEMARPSARIRANPDSMVLEPYSGKKEEGFYNVKKKVVIGGEALADASAGFDRYGQPSINFRFNSEGGKKFGQITRENVDKPFAIVLDGKVLTAPRINEPILGGSGQITGNFTIQEAQDLSLLLRAGALPAPLEVLEERTVGPSLGQDSIDAGKAAALVGVALVIVMMILFYGLFGLFSNISLIINMVLIVAILSLFQATLTLPGIAGMVLTMGIAVDANVLIFERIKEEMRVGKTPFAAVDNGFKQAFKTIIDSNITTLIATFILFTFGTGAVKGFAVTLSIGILCSMFSAILLTRMMVVLWLKKTKPNSLPL